MTDKLHAFWEDGEAAWAEAEQYWRGEWPKAFSTGWPAVDEFYKIALGQMTLVGGIANHGKSTWLDALMVNICFEHGFKACVYSPENHPLGIHAWHLCEKFIGKPMMPGNKWGERINGPEMVEAGKWISDHFRFLTPNEINVDGILQAATKAWEADPYEILVLDPWNEFGDNRPNGFSETDHISLSLGNFRRWAREHKVHLFLAVHPKKLERDKSGNYPVPTAWDLAGSAHWRNKADNIVTFWRDFSTDDDTAELHIQKIRFAHIGRVPKEPIALMFHPATKSFSAREDAQKGNYWIAPFQRKK